MDIQLSDHFTYKRLLSFTKSPIIMLIFTSIYGVVDGYFVSNVVGDTAFAAINLVMPFVMLLGGVGFMVGTGGTALVAKRLGEGKDGEARRYFTMLVKFTVLLGLFVSTLGFIFMRPIVTFLGAKGDLVENCVLYGKCMAAFNTPFMIQVLFHSFCVTAERPKLGLVATVAAGITNMVLDALFIAIFKWGVAGAAFATGFSQCVGALIPIFYFMKPKRAQLWFVKARIEFGVILKACTNGVSEFLSNIANSIAGMAYNWQLLRYFGQSGVSAYGVLMYINFVFIAVFIGYSVGSAPIIGFHYGAKNTAELKGLLRKSTVIIGTTGVFMAGAALLLARLLASIFVGYNAELMSLTVRAIWLFAPSFLFVGFNLFVSSFFTALNNGLVSAIASFMRTLVFELLAVTLLPLLIGREGVWIATLAAEFCAFLTGMLLLFINRKKYGYM